MPTKKPKEWEMVFYYTVWVDNVQYTVFYKNPMVKAQQN